MCDNIAQSLVDSGAGLSKELRLGDNVGLVVGAGFSRLEMEEEEDEDAGGVALGFDE